jgi:hypothetical protein
LTKAAQETSNATIDFLNAISGVDSIPKGFLDNLTGVVGGVSKDASAGDAFGEEGTIKRKRAKRAPVDPDAPKKPTTMYFTYSIAARKIIKEEREAKGLEPLGNTEMTTEISSRWNALSPEEKRPWKELYETQKAKYYEEMTAYNERKALGQNIPKKIEKLVEEEEEDEEEEPAKPAKVAKVNGGFTPAATSEVLETPKSSKKSKKKAEPAPLPIPVPSESPDKKKEKKDKKKKRKSEVPVPSA